MKKYLFVIFTVFVFMVSNPVYAVEETGFVRILDLGCSQPEKGGECFVIIDTPDAFGPEACEKRDLKQARWFVQKENGRSILALLMSAWATNALVKLAIQDVCFEQPSSGDTWPGIAWVHIRHPGDVN
ncbi:hypothetical protein SAMN05216302_105210 [Nitrosomonas aestuarii]|uniref:Uncharacterized protein n=1 Tax=Nitrosomonas aestuarii TaxID=52441 RepID=A0A1I4GCW6_9PROT|nr:hypothetical protein [Nitrosomonas aestuarii]SFL27898.1 hypothetical protein SAMN05216302_105210 [Nitrosomonas aestuarii]